jgi:tetratricopeptide (TPR) repeat protein
MRRLLPLLIGLTSLAFGASKLEVTSPLGTKYYSLPDEKKTVADAEKNLAADPKNPDLLLKAALAHAAIREYKESIAICTRGLAITPNNADLLLERGHREVGLRDFTHARADLERAVKVNPKLVDAYYHLGLSHYFLGEFAQSAEAFGHAVELAPNLDSRINSSNWWYASLRRAKQNDQAAKALAQITPDMKNTEPHTFFYLSLIRFFQGKMAETDAVPPEPPAENTDLEAELRFDTVAYGVGNWYLYNGNPAKAQEYFRRVVKGQAWMTWGFIGAELEVAKTAHAK